MFKPDQLLQAIILDSVALLISIKQGLATDPIAQVHPHRLWSCQPCPNSMDDPWSLSKDGGFLLFKRALYVPDHAGLGRARHSTDCCLPIPGFKAGNQVWLYAQNITTKHPSKKLGHHHFGPFLIVVVVSSHAACLRLWFALQCIHPVFHISFLQSASISLILNIFKDPPPPPRVDDSNEYKVHQILDSKIDQCQMGSGLLYCVKWSGFDNTAEAASWEPEENIWNAPDLVWVFHHANPNWPKLT